MCLLCIPDACGADLTFIENTTSQLPLFSILLLNSKDLFIHSGYASARYTYYEHLLTTWELLFHSHCYLSKSNFNLILNLKLSFLVIFTHTHTHTPKEQNKTLPFSKKQNFSCFFLELLLLAFKYTIHFLI